VRRIEQIKKVDFTNNAYEGEIAIIELDFEDVHEMHEMARTGEEVCFTSGSGEYAGEVVGTLAEPPELYLLRVRLSGGQSK